VDVDFTKAIGLEIFNHGGPSTVDHRTHCKNPDRYRFRFFAVLVCQTI
jgi:hypothetical protein